MQKMDTKTWNTDSFLGDLYAEVALSNIAQIGLTFSSYLKKKWLCYFALAEQPMKILGFCIKQYVWELRRWVGQVEKFGLQISKTVGYLAYLFFLHFGSS